MTNTQSLAQQSEEERREREDLDFVRAREEWFYQQRAYPLDRIPAGARLGALRQLDRMIEARRRGAAPSVDSGSNIADIPTSAWSQIGPQPTNHPFFPPTTSGRVTAMAVDPTNDTVVYLGAAEGGVWKTTNGGANWTALTDQQPALAVGALALDPTNPNVVYAGTGELNFNFDAYFGAGILKSSDGGNTWTQLRGTPPNCNFVGPFSAGNGGARVGSIAVHPTNGQVVLAAFAISSGAPPSGICRSTDAGATWTSVLAVAAGTEVLFNPANGNIAYAAIGSPFPAGTHGIYKSVDAGLTWAPLTGGLPTANVGRIEIAIAPSNPQVLYAAIQNAAGFPSPPFGSLLGVWKSIDGGANWAPLPAPDFCNPQCWYDMVLRVDPTNANRVFAGGADPPSSGMNGTLIRSSDGGLSWENVSRGASGTTLHVDHHALAFSAGGRSLYVGNDGGAYRNDNPAADRVSINWTSLNDTLAITQFYGGHAIHPTDENISLGGTQDNGTQKKSTASLAWNWVTCGDGGWAAIDPTSPNVAYTTCTILNSPYIRRSFSGGDPPWDGAVIGINPGDSGRTQFIPPLVMDPSNPQNLYTPSFRVYQTRNGAASWAAISGDLTGGSSHSITTVAVQPGNSNVVVVGTTDGRVQQTLNALAGATWTDATGTGLPRRTITQVAVDRNISATVYATFSGYCGFGGDTKGHVFKTTNAGPGATWTDISGSATNCTAPTATDLPNVPVNDMIVDPDIPDTLYVATDIGVFATSNGGATWAPLGTGLPRVAVLSLVLRRATRTVRAATHGRSAWSLQFLPAVSLSTTNVLFGNQRLGTTSAPQTVTLSNTGSGILLISTVVLGGANPVDFAIAAGTTCNSGTTLPPGGSCILRLTFTPTALRSRAATVTITDNASPPTQVINLSGTGTGPGVILTPPSLTFPSQRVGTPSPTQDILLANDGTDTLNISRITVTGANPADFLLVSPTGGPPCPLAGGPVRPGENCRIGVRFQPTNPGARSANVSIADDAFPNTHTVPLTGAAVGPGASFNPTSLGFGSQLITTTSAPQTVALTNTGNLVLNIGGITVTGVHPGDFALVPPGGSPCPLGGGQLAVGATCNISATFRPSVVGNRSAAISVADDAVPSPQFVPLSGAGILDFSVSAAPPGSATVSAGQSATYTIIVTPLVGGFPNAVNLACSAGLPSGATCSFNPPSVTPGGNPANSTLTISTASRAWLLPTSPVNDQAPRPLYLLWLTATILLVAVATLARRRLRMAGSAAFLALMLLIVSLAVLVSCTGVGSNAPPGRTPPGTSTITVTGVSGSQSHSTTVSLTIN